MEVRRRLSCRRLVLTYNPISGRVTARSQENLYGQPSRFGKTKSRSKEKTHAREDPASQGIASAFQWLTALHGAPAVHHYHLSGDERVPQRQESDRIGDVVRCCRALHRSRLDITLHLLTMVRKPTR